MVHLNKITISNARRFGKDVEMDLCSGANIVLAPNGTGKTTLFEAIEFALAGSVQRLSETLPLIRDKQSSLHVRLDFNDKKYCEVNYDKGSEPKLSGDHLLIYPNKNQDEIPFLLRLTHLLDQRGSSWFIQKNSNDAGSLLDKLSLGKELTTIFQERTSIRNASTRFQNRIKVELETAEKQLSNFEEKLSERKSVSNDFELTPLKELVESINSVLLGINAVIDKSIGTKLDSILLHLENTKSQLLTIDESNSQLQLKLSRVQNKIEIYDKNSVSIREKEDNESRLLKEKEKYLIELISVKNKISPTKELINGLNTDLEKLKEIQKSFSRLNENQKKQLLSKKKKDELSGILSTHKTNLSKTNSSINDFNKLLTQGKLLESREERLKTKRGEIKTLESTLSDWKRTQVQITERQQIVKSFLKDKALNNDSLKQHKEVLSTQELKLGKSNSKLSGLREVSSSIQSAISIISSNIPENQTECPVCSASYEPEELRERINTALEGIDPLLTQEIEVNKQLQSDVDLTTETIRKIEGVTAKLELDLSTSSQMIQEFQKAIDEKFLPRFQGCETLEEGEVFIKNEKTNLEKEVIVLNEERNSLPAQPDEIELEKLKLNQNQEEQEIIATEKSINKILTEIEEIDSTIADLKEKTAGTTIEKTDLAISKVEGEIKKAKNDLQKAENQQEKFETRKTEIEKQLINEEALLSQLQGQQNEILAEWVEAGLTDTPSTISHSKRKRGLQKNSKNYEGYKKTLAAINDELSRWKIAEKFDELDRFIKEECGKLSEEDYLNKLNEGVQKLKNDVGLVDDKKRALDQFLDDVSSEMGNIHDQIVSINSPWISLLKRVVINPTFTETQLESYSYRNNPHAEVKTALHGTQVSVMDVASEAQATDLQLTFMLAMASNYQWTPWKALLLDDPTQHHDLVHAAGVFDLLRDYILDQGFQVLLATHDAVQARFFQRKLQNDGIPVKLWNLVSDREGVKAISI